LWKSCIWETTNKIIIETEKFDNCLKSEFDIYIYAKDEDSFLKRLEEPKLMVLSKMQEPPNTSLHMEMAKKYPIHMTILET